MALLALLCTLCLFVTTGSVSARAGPLSERERQVVEASGIVGRDMIDRLERDGFARVMIVFDVPGVPEGPPGRRFAGPAARRALRATAEAILERFAAGEFELRHRYGAINAVAGTLRSRGLPRLLADPRILRVDLDLGGAGHLTEAVPLVRLDRLQALGFTGAGVTVAVLDSGLDRDHPDLADDLVGEQCFCSASGAGCCPAGGTSQGGFGSAEDDHGHGTNVTGILTSAGTVAPRGGAPDAEIVAIKVLDGANSFCCASDIVAGLDWIIDNRPDVDLVNMSLGTSMLFEGHCDSATSFTIAMATAIDALRARGTLSFASAGNEGSATQMSAPACISSTIAVGAVYDSDVGFSGVPGVCADPATRADQVTCFSNSDAATDLFAPGAPTTSTGIGGGTSTFRGTSQASPLAAACAAALLGTQPGLTPDELEAALEGSSTLVTDPKNGLSFPRLDCAEAAGLGTPAIGAPVPGKTLVLKDRAAEAGQRKVVFLSRGESIPAPLASPIVTGGSLTIFNPRSGETDTYPLPAGAFEGSRGWKGLGRPAGTGGFKYLDPLQQSGPCKVVLVRPGTLLRAVCRGSQIAYSLGESESAPGANDAQGAVAVRLSIGGTDYCTEFPGSAGRVLRDFGTPDRSSGLGLFRSSDAPAPSTCSVP